MPLPTAVVPLQLPRQTPLGASMTVPALDAGRIDR